MSKYTQFTLKLLRDRGYSAEVVERWIVRCKKRIDLWNVVDIIAMREDKGIVGVQSTSAAHHADHLAKARAEPLLERWLRCGGKFALISWKKKRLLNKDGQKGKRFKWVPRIETIKKPTTETMAAVRSRTLAVSKTVERSG